LRPSATEREPRVEAAVLQSVIDLATAASAPAAVPAPVPVLAPVPLPAPAPIKVAANDKPAAEPPAPRRSGPRRPVSASNASATSHETEPKFKKPTPRF
jgi:hypothetical protein